MKLSILSILVTLWASFLVSARPNEGYHERGEGQPQSADATPIRGGTFRGTPSPPSPVRGEGDEEDPGPAIPTGKPRGPITPSSPQVNLKIMGGSNINANATVPRTKRQECGGGGGIAFDTSTVFGISSGFPPAEPSGAKAGNVVFSTANFLAAISLDGGATFHTIDPTVYSGPANPATDAGFCCDQIVQYLPSIDRFAWLIQYWPNSNGANKLRLITFHPRDVNTNGINSWIYLDILSTDLGLIKYFDAGELAVGDNYLWLAANNKDTGLVVFRIPIASLDVVGSLTYWYTDANNGRAAYLSRLSQNPGDTLFWGGHSSYGTTMRIFKWPESGTTYFWNDIRINDWPSGSSSFVSTCPGGSSTNWIYSAAFATVLGSTRRSTNEVWFAWAAPSGGGFPNVHIQIAQINTANWPNLQLIKQWQIWNSDFAFIYPAFYTNKCGDVGLTVMFGGGSFNPSSAVGIANSDGVVSQTVYYPELSGVCEDRFGDYVTVRSEDGFNYEGFVYGEQSTGGGIQRNVRFVEFHK
ncbi:MAG: hypothetical protein M1813_000393 [Trichoglossum hirsutum]|nr:MAG: hypothetical protein M1813_000393 [Trichoglossum hirsutum]